jgi:hypothetical protein
MAVTSVGLAMPGEFSVTGSPVTASGTLSVAKNNQSANTVYSGPSSGGAVAPTFRALVQADLPGVLASGSSVSRALGTRFADSFNVRDYGAIGDGSTNDYAAIQAAINAAQTNGGLVVFPPGRYLSNSTLTVQADSVVLVGVGQPSKQTTSKGAVLINGSTTSDLLAFSNCSGSGMSGFLIYTAGTPTAGYGVTFDTCYNCTVELVRIESVWNGIKVYRSTGTRLTDIEMRDLKGTRGVQYEGTSSITSNSLFITRMVTDMPGTNNTSCDWISMYDYAYSIQVLDTHLINGGRGFVIDSSSSLIVPKFAALCNINTDHTSGSGISIGRAEDVRIVNSWVGSDLTNNGITIGSTFIREFSVLNSRIHGNKQHGVLINGGEGVHIKDCAIGNNSANSAATYHGVTVGANISNFYIMGNNFRGTPGNPQGYAVVVSAGTSTRYVITHNDMTQQQTGAMTGVTAVADQKIISPNVTL